MKAVAWIVVILGFFLSAPIAALAVGAYHSKGICESDPSLQYDSPKPASIVLHIKNENVKAYYNVCVLDADGGNLGRYEFSLGLGANDERTLTWDLPAEVVEYRVAFGGASFGGPTSSVNRIDLAKCPGYRHEAEFTAMSGPMGNKFVLKPTRCDPDDAGAPAIQEQGMLPVPSIRQRVPPAVYGGLGVAAAAAIWLRRRDALWLPALFGLFSRLTQPAVLGQKVRSQIRDVVASDPGIHLQAIADRLEVARSVVGYHVFVLCRSGIFAKVELPGQNCFFVRGEFSPTRMAQMAVLRSPSLAQAFKVIQEHSGITSTELGRALGLGSSRVSKVAKRLVEVGLIRKSVRNRHAVFQAVA